MNQVSHLQEEAESAFNKQLFIRSSFPNDDRQEEATDRMRTKWMWNVCSVLIRLCVGVCRGFGRHPPKLQVNTTARRGWLGFARGHWGTAAVMGDPQQDTPARNLPCFQISPLHISNYTSPSPFIDSHRHPGYTQHSRLTWVMTGSSPKIQKGARCSSPLLPDNSFIFPDTSQWRPLTSFALMTPHSTYNECGQLKTRSRSPDRARLLWENRPPLVQIVTCKQMMYVYWCWCFDMGPLTGKIRD